MTEAAIGLMTALGLSTATGLNAYLPLLILGGLARWTDLITLDTRISKVSAALSGL